MHESNTNCNVLNILSRFYAPANQQQQQRIDRQHAISSSRRVHTTVKELASATRANEPLTQIKFSFFLFLFSSRSWWKIGMNISSPSPHTLTLLYHCSIVLAYQPFMLYSRHCCTHQNRFFFRPTKWNEINHMNVNVHKESSIIQNFSSVYVILCVNNPRGWDHW